MKLPGVRRGWETPQMVPVQPPRYDLLRVVHFCPPNHAPLTLNDMVMTEAQEGRRRDVELLFAVL